MAHENEPILMAIDYCKGRVFHITLGHSDELMMDVGFVVTLYRGAEWAAMGKVMQPLPENLPTPEKVVKWMPRTAAY